MHGRLLLFPRRRKDYTPAGSNAGSDTGLPMMDWLPTRERGRGTFYDSSFPTVDRLSVRFWWLRSPEKKIGFCTYLLIPMWMWSMARSPGTGMS